jgi:hypothetical protein
MPCPNVYDHISLTFRGKLAKPSQEILKMSIVRNSVNQVPIMVAIEKGPIIFENK